MRSESRRSAVSIKPSRPLFGENYAIKKDHDEQFAATATQAKQTFNPAETTDKETEKEYHVNQLMRGSANAAAIPIPVIKHVEQDALPVIRNAPMYYTHIPEDLPPFVQYDLEYPDFQFIEDLTGEARRLLTPDLVEWIMDRLEVTFPQVIPSLSKHQVEGLYETFRYLKDLPELRVPPVPCISNESKAALALAREAVAFGNDPPPPVNDFHSLPVSMFVDVYEHWYERRSRIGNALIMHLRRPPPRKDNDFSRPFRVEGVAKDHKKINSNRMETLNDNIKKSKTLMAQCVASETRELDIFMKRFQRLNQHLRNGISMEKLCEGRPSLPLLHETEIPAPPKRGRRSTPISASPAAPKPSARDRNRGHRYRDESPAVHEEEAVQKVVPK
ncbi:hypothetical protein KIPB_009542, partial [Kipferlia bialata]|eukprot:g9542.t1